MFSGIPWLCSLSTLSHSVLLTVLYLIISYILHMSKPRFVEFNSPAQIPLTASGQTSIWSQSWPIFQTPNVFSTRDSAFCNIQMHCRIFLLRVDYYLKCSPIASHAYIRFKYGKRDTNVLVNFETAKTLISNFWKW